MHTYEIFIDDARYSVPTLQLVAARDTFEALEMAQALMRDGAHHLGVELCHGGLRLAGLGTYADGARRQSLAALPETRDASAG